MSDNTEDEFINNMRSLLDMVDNKDSIDIEDRAPIFCSLSDGAERYKNFELIAKGGMKRVARVFDTKTNRHVAMAKLHEDATIDFYDSFIREARLTALLDHPNIISIFDIGIDQNMPYFTMELKSGETLESILQESPTLPLTERLQIFIKICDAVSYAHSQDVIHLDLKPANIQVGKYGEVIVCDWGLGKVLNGQEVGGENDDLLFNPDMLNHMTLSGSIKGTPGFMAPEQINNEWEKGQLSDIYSLGCILYYILTGTTPLSGSSVEEVIQKTVTQGGDSLRKNFPVQQLPISLEAVVLKALKLVPQDRYQSVESLSQEVTKFLNGYATQAENAGFPKEFELFYVRNRNACLSIFISLIIIVIGALYFIDSLNESRQKAEEARTLSEKNRKVAIQEKERANELLSLYQTEKKWGSAFIEENLEVIKSEVYKYSDRLTYDDSSNSFEMALSYLNRLIEEQSGFNWGHNQRAYIFFLMQEFTNAKEDYAVNNRGDKNFIKLAHKYAFKSERGKALNIENMKTLIGELFKFGKKYQAQILIMMRYDAIKRLSLTEHSELIKKIIQLYNPGWKTSNFNYSRETRELTLRGQKLKTLLMQS